MTDLERIGFNQVFAAAGSPEFLKAVEQAVPERDPHQVGDDIYAACFGTPAGRMVLEDMWRMYVNGTRFIPGEDATVGFFREGRAAVLFDIIARLESHARRGEDE